MQTLTQPADAAFENAWQELGIHQHIIANCIEPSEIAKWGWRAALAWQQIQSPATEQSGEAVAWVRFRSDGGYEGPIMDCDARMEGSRRTSGAWTPLYTRQQPAPAVPEKWREAVQNASAVLGWMATRSDVCKKDMERMEAADAALRALLSAVPQPAQQLRAWLRRASMFGPWIECKSQDDGAVLFSAPQQK